MSLRLSEAIRLGATLRPQAFGWSGLAGGKSCALWAAYEAAGVGPGDCKAQLAIGKLWLLDRPWCPDYCVGPWDAADLVIHLNDKHRWTRERIADWVQRFEPEPGEAEAGAPGSRLLVSVD